MGEGFSQNALPKLPDSSICTCYNYIKKAKDSTENAPKKNEREKFQTPQSLNHSQLIKKGINVPLYLN